MRPNHVTDAEAARLCCPIMTRPEHGQNCIGSSCALWRISSQAVRRFLVCDDVAAGQEPTRPALLPTSWKFEPHDPEEGEPAQWIEPEIDADARNLGYCGLGGRAP